MKMIANVNQREDISLSVSELVDRDVINDSSLSGSRIMLIGVVVVGSDEVVAKAWAFCLAIH